MNFRRVAAGEVLYVERTYTDTTKSKIKEDYVVVKVKIPLSKHNQPCVKGDIAVIMREKPKGHGRIRTC